MTQTKIAQLRAAAGLSQSQLAKLAGVSIRTIQCYERGGSNPAQAYAEIIIKLADALGVHPRELI